MFRSAFLVLLAATAALPFASSLAQGQQPYPNRPVTIVVGYAPGGTADSIARIIGAGLNKRTGVSVVIDNKAGADERVAASFIAKAKPDGYTLYLATSSVSINFGVSKKLPYDPLNDFSAVGMIGVIPNVIVVNPGKVQARTFSALVAESKAHDFSYGVTAANTLLGYERLRKTAGLKAQSIPFKGGASMIPLLLTGEVEIASTAVSTALPYVKDGRLNVIMVNDARRNPLLPGVPSSKELGLGNFADGAWFGILTPAGVPPEVLAQLYVHMKDILNAPENRQRVTDLGLTLGFEDPATFLAFVKNESLRLKAEAQELGVSLD